MSKESKLNEIHKSDLELDPEAYIIGSQIIRHKCHMRQEETEWGRESLAKNPGGFDGSGRTLIVGYNPYMLRYGDETRARCSFCDWPASEECQAFLDTLEGPVTYVDPSQKGWHYKVPWPGLIKG